MENHDIKATPEHFNDLWEGRKTFEARLNDRDYKVGDKLLIREYLPKMDYYTSRYILAEVSHILYGGACGIEQGHCIMSLRNIYRCQPYK